jgi:hypothetical protein
LLRFARNDSVGDAMVASVGDAMAASVGDAMAASVGVAMAARVGDAIAVGTDIFNSGYHRIGRDNRASGHRDR